MLRNLLVENLFHYAKLYCIPIIPSLCFVRVSKLLRVVSRATISYLLFQLFIFKFLCMVRML